MKGFSTQRIPPPEVFLKADPAPYFVSDQRERAIRIVEGKDPKLILLLGPCSIHCEESAFEIAEKIQQLPSDLLQHVFPILRCFVEKPRTRLGWKGFVYDPTLDEKHDLIQGIQRSRKLLSTLTASNIACSMEFVHPFLAPYLQDLICWGVIGARTCTSQAHRQLAASLPFPVGFKNDLSGDIEPAIDSIVASQEKGFALALSEQGELNLYNHPGNPHTHLILRGGRSGPNSDPLFCQKAAKKLQENNLSPKFILDCAHGNKPQEASFFSSLEQLKETDHPILGLMLETHLFAGKQPLLPKNLRYGVSITDSCLGWEEVSFLLSHFTSIFSVQN